MTDMRLFGAPSYQNIKAAQEAGFHKKTCIWRFWMPRRFGTFLRLI